MGSGLGGDVQLLLTFAAYSSVCMGEFFGGATPQFQHCLPQHDSIHVSQPQPEPGSVPLLSWVLEASPTHMEINTNTD